MKIDSLINGFTGSINGIVLAEHIFPSIGMNMRRFQRIHDEQFIVTEVIDGGMIIQVDYITKFKKEQMYGILCEKGKNKGYYCLSRKVNDQFEKITMGNYKFERLVINNQ